MKNENIAIGNEALKALTTGEEGRFIHRPSLTGDDQTIHYDFNPDSVKLSNDTIEHKASVLLALGFVSRGFARWYSPVLGEDLEQNWLYFDLQTDDLTSILPKLYRSGYVKGQQNIRFQLKSLLDL